jgi:hypothetical protein
MQAIERMKAALELARASESSAVPMNPEIVSEVLAYIDALESQLNTYSSDKIRKTLESTISALTAENERLRTESEERLQNCAALDRPDARPHRYRVQGNDAWNHYGTRGQAMTTREAFEDWYEVDSYPCEHSNWFRRDSDGDYEFDEVQYAWRTWQAVTASALERAAEEIKKLDKRHWFSKQSDFAEFLVDAIRTLKDEK